MYDILLKIHSIASWLVIAGLLIPLLGTYAALVRPRPFSAADSMGIRLGTTAAHIQLLVGIALYAFSPYTGMFWSDPGAAAADRQLLFFGIIHMIGMIVAVVLMTVGSARARRAETAPAKFRAIATYWTIALLVIALLVPWSFSPFV
jgi:hypothetical protein